MGNGEIIPIATLSPTECLLIKMGSDESHFNVSLIVGDKVIRLCPQITTFEEKGEPNRLTKHYKIQYILFIEICAVK